MPTPRPSVALLASLSLALLAPAAGAQIRGQRLAGVAGLRETTASIARRQAAAPPPVRRLKRELEIPGPDRRPQNPAAPAVARWPPAPEAAVSADAEALAARGSVARIHTPTAVTFDGATLSDTGAFPPDSTGAVGPTQFVVFVNGRLRTFAKSGVADGVFDLDPDVFFASVMTPLGGLVLDNFTSDPLVRYDRFTARWILAIIDVPCTSAGCATTGNRLLLAVSDVASNGTITAATAWTFFRFQPSGGTDFCDYPSLGVDVQALYLGCNMFSSAGSFVGTDGFVVQKASVLGGGPIVTTKFHNLATRTGAGPFSPRGVDNTDRNATAGWFVGVDNASFGTIVLRRVANPGSPAPTISGDIAVAVPATTAPNPVEHLGNTRGSLGRLDAVDDRLYAATIRDGRLWTAHNLRVDASGVAGTAVEPRNASRWYEFGNLDTTPTLVQSGTVYDAATRRVDARQYFIPSVAVTGQGHAVLGLTMAGNPVGATPAYVGRLAGDPPGTMTGPPTAPAIAFGTSAASYNPPSDPGGSSGRRWGDYSFTSVDPLDEMTVWTIQEYNQAPNTYAVRVAKLAAPPPPSLACATTPVAVGPAPVDVTVTASGAGGAGFFDPGPDLAPPALPFAHLAATLSNATVTGVTLVSPTEVTLHVAAFGAGRHDLTITNPDGQSVAATGCVVQPLFASGFEGSGLGEWGSRLPF